MKNSKRNAPIKERASKPRPTVAELEAKRNNALDFIKAFTGGAIIYCILFTIYTYASRWF